MPLAPLLLLGIVLGLKNWTSTVAVLLCAAAQKKAQGQKSEAEYAAELAAAVAAATKSAEEQADAEQVGTAHAYVQKSRMYAATTNGSVCCKGRFMHAPGSWVLRSESNAGRRANANATALAAAAQLPTAQPPNGCAHSCLPACLLQAKAVAAAVAEAVAKAQEEAAAAAAEAQEAARAEARAAALEEAAAMLVDVMYLGTVSTARTAQQAQRSAAERSMPGTCIGCAGTGVAGCMQMHAAVKAAQLHNPAGLLTGLPCRPAALPVSVLAWLQNFDTVTRAPFLGNMAYHERTSAVAYAQHFGVQLSGERESPCLPACLPAPGSADSTAVTHLFCWGLEAASLGGCLTTPRGSWLRD